MCTQKFTLEPNTNTFMFLFFFLSFIMDSYRKLNELLHMTVMTESLLDDIVIIETKLFSLGVYWMILLSKMSSSNFEELESVRVWLVPSWAKLLPWQMSLSNAICGMMVSHEHSLKLAIYVPIVRTVWSGKQFPRWFEMPCDAKKKKNQCWSCSKSACGRRGIWGYISLPSLEDYSFCSVDANWHQNPWRSKELPSSLSFVKSRALFSFFV